MVFADVHVTGVAWVVLSFDIRFITAVNFGRYTTKRDLTHLRSLKSSYGRRKRIRSNVIDARCC